jgi:anti-anti-sigma factor
VRELVIVVRTSGVWNVIALAGELDFHTAAQVRVAVEAQELGPGRRLVVDLGGLTFCDSSGITAMLVAQRLAVAADSSLVLAAVPDRIARTFTLAGLDPLFVVHPTTADATAGDLV